MPTGARAVYLDLDGTLLDPGGRVTRDTLEAIDVLRSAGWVPVLLTGRSRPVAAAVGRLFGVQDVVCELGAVVLARGDEHRTVPRDAAGTPLRATPPELPGLPEVLAALAAAGDGGARAHEPGTPRDGGHVLRLAGPAAAATRALADAGLGAWHAVDNGPSHLPMDDGAPGRVVHVVPRGVDKRAGVLEHRALRGVALTDAAALGDSPADLDVAPAVGRFVLVAGDPVAVAAAGARGVPVTRGVAAAGALEGAHLLTRP